MPKGRKAGRGPRIREMVVKSGGQQGDILTEMQIAIGDAY